MNYDLKYFLIKAALKGMYAAQAHKWMAPLAQGKGVILMLHKVTAAPPPSLSAARAAFEPTRNLKVSAAFLERVIQQVLDLGLDVVSLDEAVTRLRTGGQSGEHRRFVCFTFDDGYRDNKENAWPLFKRYQLPFTIYIPSDFPDGRGEMWWLALEKIIAKADEVQIPDFAGAPLGGQRFDCTTTSQKSAAYWRIYWPLRQIGENLQRRIVRVMAKRHGLDLQALCRSEIMSWDEIRELNRDPLVTIGGHTAGHFAVKRLSPLRCRAEIKAGLDRLTEELGERPKHFAFPYGDAGSAGPRDFKIAKSLGLETAVTTRRGVLFADHRDHLHALPRVSLNGDFQSTDYTALFLSGAPFALFNGFRKLNVA